jgi:hypothetical protein
LAGAKHAPRRKSLQRKRRGEPNGGKRISLTAGKSAFQGVKSAGGRQYPFYINILNTFGRVGGSGMAADFCGSRLEIF